MHRAGRKLHTFDADTAPVPPIWLATTLVLIVACGGATPATTPVGERMDAIAGAVTEWRNAATLESARAAAEEAANLIVGPNGPDFGDRDGDGVVGGNETVGLLPGLDGTPSGLAVSLAGNECVGRDVLGGAWTDPGAEWAAMLAAIESWRADNNTMPTLASHPMRVVGWATLTLRAGSLEEAHEYAGHARLHVDISRRALEC